MADFFPVANYPGIFSSPAWISAWQKSWGEEQELALLTPHDHQTVTPRTLFYSYRWQQVPVLKFITIFPAGISTTAAPSIRSEYFVVEGFDAASYLKVAMGYSWGQFFIPDLLLNSVFYQQLVTAAKSWGLVVRTQDVATTYAVNLKKGTFDNYLSRLGSNTRLKLFNKRKKLYQMGSVRLENMWPKLDEFIEILNKFHLARWGKPCYQGRNLQQIKLFLHAIAAEGGNPELSVMYCNDRPISAVLDLQYRQRIYNIQSGYLEAFAGGVSLGTLHFGFQLEQAFKSDALFYDFMAGNGKHANYKASLATASDSFVSLMLVRNPILKLLYKVNDGIKSLRPSKKITFQIAIKEYP